jgi:hypothetical protein
MEEGWHRGKEVFSDSMNVPGAPQAQGIGEPHQFQRTMFMEPFWIRREFRLRALKPAERVWLRLGAVLPAARIYVNGQYVGYTRSSRTGQRVDITCDWVLVSGTNYSVSALDRSPTVVGLHAALLLHYARVEEE